MKSSILIYTTNSCPYCVRAKSYFISRGLDFTEINLTNKYAEIENLKRSTGHRTIPLIFVNDQFIGGYTDMIEKIENGELNFE